MYARSKKILATHFVFLCLLLALLGCGHQNDPQPMLADYLQRVKNITDSKTLPAQPPLQLPAWPSPRDRRLAIPEQIASVADWFRLRDCELFVLINERNSILGRVRQPSQRLIYELRFLQLVPACVERLVADAGADVRSPAAEKLTAIAQIKADALPANYWNATIAGDEFAALVSSAERGLLIGDSVGSSATRSALQQLSQLAKAVTAPLEYKVDASAYENANRELVISQWVGQLNRSQQLLITSLNQAAIMLEQRLAKKPLCRNERANRKAEVFRNVFQRYYAAAVQPYMAQVQQQTDSWHHAVQPLLEPVPEDQRPELIKLWMNAYLSANGTLQGAYKAALQRHTKAWQAVLGQCGMMPGSANY